MEGNTNSYRIRTKVGDEAPNVINVKLDQKFKVFEILSLKLRDINAYTTYKSNYGLVVGRVLANGGFGIPNAKISVFIPVEDDETFDNRMRYMYGSVSDTDENGVRYNLLPNYEVDDCYQNVGTFPSKRYILDNDSTLELFEKYYKYTTVSNQSGDYMMYGIPTGSQQLHVDIDLSDIDPLSQRPRDMIAKGYNVSQFESPNKFKQSPNLNSLPQIINQDIGLYVYPFTGDTSDESDTGESEVAITRCDIQVGYKFEPTCVFMGCAITDTGSNAINKSCLAIEQCGRMDSLTGGTGSIEMIRKTVDGKTEQYQVNGDRNIDGNGTWCYQIPMNLDFVKTDEYGNIVPSDNPKEGLPTRARVRFRISMDEQQTDDAGRNRARYLVPNNPNFNPHYPEFSKKVGGNSTHEPDYEFGTNTLDESYKDLLWNKVYTVKSYIPRVSSVLTQDNKTHTGIKAVNYNGNNNPFPFNALYAKVNFTMRFLCRLASFIIILYSIINAIISVIAWLPCELATWCIKIFSFKICPFGWMKKAIPKCLGIGSSYCDDGVHKYTYFPGCIDCVCRLSEAECLKGNVVNPDKDDEFLPQQMPNASCHCGKAGMLMNCIQSQLAQDNECTRFNFHSDWINGCLYFPLFLRIQPASKKYSNDQGKTFELNNLSGQFCSADGALSNTYILSTCANPLSNYPGVTFTNFVGNKVKIDTYVKFNAEESTTDKGRRNETVSYHSFNYGIIKAKKTNTGAVAYYYKPCEYINLLPPNNYVKMENKEDTGENLKMFATDIILLGSLDECDRDGIPQFFKQLNDTTYNTVPNLLFASVQPSYASGTGEATGQLFFRSEMAGQDWGNIGMYDQCVSHDDAQDSDTSGKVHFGGLYYNAGCNHFTTSQKTCINLVRTCEFGVNVDSSKPIVPIDKIDTLATTSNLSRFFGNEDYLAPDGFQSYEDLNNIIGRKEFATMNCNELHTIKDSVTGLMKYELYYMNVDNFDGAAQDLMANEIARVCHGQEEDAGLSTQSRYETPSNDYYTFRMGAYPYMYKNNMPYPRYENSFYFYFGIKAGSTAIGRFFNDYYAPCTNPAAGAYGMIADIFPNGWCEELNGQMNGAIAINVKGIATPYSVTIDFMNDTTVNFTISNIDKELAYFGKKRVSIYDDNGYKWYDRDDYGNQIGLSNGTYKITVVDANGEVRAIEKGMSPQNLSVDVGYVGFINPWNVLQVAYTTYCDIANDKSGNPQDRVSNMGGALSFTNFISGSVKEGDYKIEITPGSIDENGVAVDFQDQGKGQYIGTTFVVHSDARGNLSIKNQGDCGGSMGIYNGVAYAGVPKPGAKYKYKVTQVCGNKETQNIYEGSITLPNPTPFKLYINTIDYDLIYDWTSGWRINGTVENGNPTMSPIGAPSENWFNYRDETLYHWELNEETVDTNADFKANRENIITKMRTAFYMTCMGGIDVNIACLGDNRPFKYLMAYKPENAFADDNELNVLSQTTPILTTDQTVSNVRIPSITPIDSYYYGMNSQMKFHNGTLCYGTDNVGTKASKGMYFVAGLDSRGNRRPTGMNVRGAFNADTTINGFDFRGSLTPMFGFPMIDKILTANIIYWASLKNVPYFNEAHMAAGDKLATQPFIAGWITNGYSDSETIQAKFGTQTIGSIKMEIWTLTYLNGKPDEYAIPTRRIIMGPHPKNMLPHYDVYRNSGIVINGDIGDGRAIPDAQYVECNNSDDDFKIEDATETDAEGNAITSPCDMTETLQLTMTLSPTSSCLDDATDVLNSKFNVELSNGPMGVYPCIYFARTLDAGPALATKNWWMPNLVENGRYTCATYNEYSYMKYVNTRFTQDKEGSDSYTNRTHPFAQDFLNGSMVYSKHPADWDGTEGDDAGMEERNGWGTTGEFYAHNGELLLINQAIFGVAATTSEVSKAYIGFAQSSVMHYLGSWFHFHLRLSKETFLYTDDDGKDTNTETSEPGADAGDNNESVEHSLDTYKASIYPVFAGNGYDTNGGEPWGIEQPVNPYPPFFKYYESTLTGSFKLKGWTILGAKFENSGDFEIPQTIIPKNGIGNARLSQNAFVSVVVPKEFWDNWQYINNNLNKGGIYSFIFRRNYTSFIDTDAQKKAFMVYVTDASGLKHRLRMWHHGQTKDGFMRGFSFENKDYVFTIKDKSQQHLTFNGNRFVIDCRNIMNSTLNKQFIGFSVSSDSDWIVVTGTTFTVAPMDPNDTSTRQGTVTLTQTGSELEVHIFITQRNTYEFTATPVSINADMTGGTYTVAVNSTANDGTSQMEYTVQSSPDWCTCTVNGNTLTVVVDKTDAGSRTGTITLKQTVTGKTFDISVNQVDDYVFTGGGVATINAQGGTGFCVINSAKGTQQVGFTYSGEDDWVTVSVTGGIVSFTAGKNDSGAQRSCTVTFTQDDTGKTLQCVVTQDAAPATP